MPEISPIDNGLRLLRFCILEECTGLSHFVTTRHGGVSSGNYSSMNPGLYTHDLPEHIEKNRQILCEALTIAPDKLITPHQIHSDRILAIDKSWIANDDSYKCETLDSTDALVTEVPGICITVSTADCVPILLYAPDKMVVGAVHAGWRGTVSAILQKTVRFMKDTYGCDPIKMIAAIGPSISVENFEVGDEVVEAFRNSGVWTEADGESLFMNNPKSCKYHIDLWEANRLQLLYEGVKPEHIELSGICTYDNVSDFFSARRLGADSGRILSGIMINKEKNDTY